MIILAMSMFTFIFRFISYSSRASCPQVFYKVLQKFMGKPMMEFFLSKFVGCNFIMGFFPIILRNFQLFCKILLANGSVPLRHSLGFTSILKTVKVLLLLHSGSFPCAALLKQTLFGLLNK